MEHTDGEAMTADNAQAQTAARPLMHYVLFGPAEQPSTQANLLLAMDYLLAFAPAFGFSRAEAACAASVTIIADMTAVSGQMERDLAIGGARVQRVAGSVQEVAQALDQRIAAGQPF
jgi:hypothetical protein